jgi:hypothetical protein
LRHRDGITDRGLKLVQIFVVVVSDNQGVLEKHYPDILGELRALLVEVKPQKDRISEAAE